MAAKSKKVVDTELYPAVVEHSSLLGDDTEAAKNREQFQQRLLEWYDACRRKLPWRGDPPPYDGSDQASNLSRHNSAEASKTTASKGHKKLDDFFGSKRTSSTNARSLSSVTDTNGTSPQKNNETIVLDQGDDDVESSTEVEKRRAPTPYEVWVSEVMLQQTRVETVISYFLKWIEKFPTIKDLADSPLEDVNSLWAGLGYYRRAKSLHEGAKKVQQEGGSLPEDVENLLRIPGIGPYTAGAISSIAFGKPRPVVDGNVIRVYSRIFGVGMDAKSSDLNHLCWKISEQLVSKGRPGDFNQALMELGATVCTPKSPKCEQCPLKEYCTAYRWSIDSNATVAIPGEVQVHDLNKRDRTPELFPVKKKKSAVPVKCFCCGVVIRKCEDGKLNVLLSKRPEGGLLSEHWEPLCLPTEDSSNSKESPSQQPPTLFRQNSKREKKLFSKLGELSGLEKKDLIESIPCGQESHVFSHVKHEYSVDLLVVRGKSDSILPKGFEWGRISSSSEIEGYGLSTCAAKLFYTGLLPLSGDFLHRNGVEGISISQEVTDYLKGRAFPSLQKKRKRVN
eukprot:gb/GECG01014121.1/.p1 GENE.gb/GECG01014121.1/~~gb/GECG01014121.1/.p1  ORF type:complete len:564 (+),score=77.15 gb/GECG01014121.1/:1-1692(+)